MSIFHNPVDNSRIGSMLAAMRGVKQAEPDQHDKIDARLERVSHELDARLPCRGYFRH
ncbi:hypothetical protein [Roseinatronobacter alkalisoli]|uniref:DUF3563 domain-containing protein n=1 Tax=Roseinatronobacter alkalisoli TaxID=3028235 RepID=A0ABT5T734_9RHOB|nr:hypothetical protein [Roseinatronobacter sp. HJB301]MDD7970201.1 hypothetical protein [Roseinatronobacter sp. HJB301]